MCVNHLFSQEDKRRAKGKKQKKDDKEHKTSICVFFFVRLLRKIKIKLALRGQRSAILKLVPATQRKASARVVHILPGLVAFPCCVCLLETHTHTCSNTHTHIYTYAHTRAHSCRQEGRLDKKTMVVLLIGLPHLNPRGHTTHICLLCCFT